MTDNTVGSAAAGWYQDPSGAPGWRWWDGQTWTGHTAPLGGSGQIPPRSERPRLDDSAPVYNIFIWLVVLLPLISLPLQFLFTPHYTYTTIGPDHLRELNSFSMFTPGYFAALGISFVFYGATVIFSFLDRRRLMKAGVERPFHWAWSFLSSAVYVIGRVVIVRGVAPKRGMWVLWIEIAVLVLGVVVAGFVEVRIFSEIETALVA